MSDIIVTSSTSIPKNHRHISTVYSLDTMSLGILKDFKAGLGEIFGTDTGDIKGNFSKLRDRALEQLKQEAKNKGATRIIGLRIDFSQVASPNGSGILVVSMYGDALKSINLIKGGKSKKNRNKKNKTKKKY